MPRRIAPVLPAVLVASGLLMAVVAIGLAGLDRTRPAGVPPALLIAALVVLYLAGLAAARYLCRLRGVSPALILGLGLLVRLPLIAAPPYLSDDIHRYIWDGRVAAAGVNPYRYAPDAPELAPLRDPSWQKINNPGLPTIYPPAAQALFLAAAFLRSGVTGFKIILAAIDLLLALLLLKTTAARPEDRWKLLLYWWHPLVLVEFAWSGHVDVVGILLLTAACAVATPPVALAGRFRGVLVGLFAGAALLVKFLAGPAFPFLAGRRWRSAVPAFLLVAVLLYLPFMDPGVDPTGSLRIYLARWRSNDFLFGFFLAPGTALDQEARLAHAKLVCLALLAMAIVVIAAFRPSRAGGALAATGTAIILSPTIHPWYVAWLIPFLAFRFSPAWFYLTLAVLLAYQPLPRFLAGGGWQESGAVKALEFGPLALLLMVELVVLLRQRRAGPAGADSEGPARPPDQAASASDVSTGPALE